ncbi:hypothetical protein D3C71_2200720 [compost metagenome]
MKLAIQIHDIAGGVSLEKRDQRLLKQWDERLERRVVSAEVDSRRKWAVSPFPNITPWVNA